MLRIQYHRYGGPEVMRLEDVPLPEPGPGQVRVRVRAASVNPADGKVRAGMLRLVSGARFPRGMGHDFAGVVDALGPGVTARQVGDEVYGISGIRPAAAFAEYLVAAERDAYPKPANVSFEVAAALPMASVTAISGIADRADLKAGQSVFVTGCLGGIGRSAVQFARLRGAVVAGNCSAAGRDEALALGVSDVADYRAFDPAAWRGRFDLVFDTAGGLTMREAAMMLKPGGRAVHAVPSGPKLLAMLLTRRHAIASGQPTPARMAAITAAADSGALAPKIALTVPLADAIPALTEWEVSGTPKGKVVVVMG